MSNLSGLDQEAARLLEKEKEKYPNQADDISCLIDNIALLPETIKQITVQHQGVDFDEFFISDEDWEKFESVLEKWCK